MKFRSYSNFACLDDKHRVKVGEPGFPVAAAERGRRVMVGLDSSFQVGDHDFTRHSIIPSVCFLVDIPEEVESTWYSGQVVVGLKESAFEPSSSVRHCVELANDCRQETYNPSPSCFFTVTVGLTTDLPTMYLSVQVALISLFLKFDLDFLCVARTAPFHSWRNPVECIMSLLNLGLQCIGLMRKKMDDGCESAVANCNSIAQLRKVAEKNPTVKDGTLDRISPVKILMSSVFQRLELKGKNIQSFPAAKVTDIEEFWLSLKLVDESVGPEVKWIKAVLPEHPKIKEFIQHYFQLRHYCQKVWQNRLHHM